MAKKKKMKNFWSDGLSVKETRFSTILVMSLVGLGYALYAHKTTGDITDNLLDLVKVLVLSFVGINVANTVTDALRSKREEKITPDYNEVAGEEEYYNSTDTEQKY